MYSFIQTKRGFTLIELLVVIAIIGILASVVLAGLGSQRDRAQQVSAISSVRSVVPVATICTDGGGTIQDPTSATDGGGVICSNAALADDEWPDIGDTGWGYDVVTAAGSDFEIELCSDGGTCAAGQFVECTISGCTAAATI